MTNNRTGVTIVLAFLILMTVGCYIEPDQGADAAQTITIDLQSQGVLGDSGTGYYIRARLYDPADVETMLNSRDIYFDVDDLNKTIGYMPDDLLPPVMVESFYLGDNRQQQPPPSSGIIVLVDLPPGQEYRILLEIINYFPSSSPPYYPNDGAVVTEVFSVSPGSNTSLSVELYRFLGV